MDNQLLSKDEQIVAYQERKQAHIDRLRNRAAALRGEAAQSHSNALNTISGIPPGQPIMVDHHSAPAHRSALTRSDSQMRASIAATETAEALERAAAAAESNHAISSDDPLAIDKLKARLEKRQAFQEMMKRANAAIRLADEAAGNRRLIEMGFTEERIAQLRKGDYMKRVGYPTWQLSNNNADIKRIKERIESLERREVAKVQAHAANPTGTTTHRTSEGEVDLVQNFNENRLQLKFPGKPSAITREMLNRYGFKWAPSQDAWQRQLNANAERAAADVLRAIALTD